MSKTVKTFKRVKLDAFLTDSLKKSQMHLHAFFFQTPFCQKDKTGESQIHLHIGK